MHKPLLLALALLTSIASAESRIEKIKQNKTITVGYMSDDLPFSYTNDKGEYLGFSVAITHKVTESIAKELGIDNLKVEIKPITFQNRFSMMQSGELDFSCSAHSNLPERKEWVDFSHNFFTARGRLIVRTDSGIESYKDLAGKKVALISDTSLADVIPRKRTQFKFEEPMTVNSGDELLELLRNRTVDGIFDDDIMVMAKIAKNNETEQFKMIGQALALEHYACIVPKGDVEMKKLVDQALFQLFTSGDIEPIFKQWFQEPMPYLNINLNFELTPAVKSLYTNPNDKSIGE